MKPGHQAEGTMRRFNRTLLFSLICFAVLTLSVSSPAETLHQWTFDPAHAEGRNLRDVVGSADATLPESPEFVSEPSALSLDGETQDVTVGSPILPIGQITV